MTPFSTLLEALLSARVEFLLVGGVAANLHGADRTTRDLDVLYRRHPRNHQRIAGRPKDFEAIAELELIAEERRRRGEP